MALSKHRRLWRRRLRRRPLLPVAAVLLIAADIAAGLYVSRDSIGFGLCVAHFAVLSVWIAHARRGLAQRACVGVALLIVFLACTQSLPHRAVSSTVESSDAPAVIPKDWGAMITAALLGTGGALLAAVAATFSLVSRLQNGRRLASRRRFSISSLLRLTLLAAMLIWLGRGADWGVLLAPEIAIFVVVSAAAAAGTLAAALTLHSLTWRIGTLAIAPLTLLIALVVAIDAPEEAVLSSSGVACFAVMLLLLNVRPWSRVQTRRASTRT